MTQPTLVATATVTSTSVGTPHVQTSTTNKPPSIDGAKAPSLTTDGSSRVQRKIPYSAPSTSFQVSTYPNTLPIFLSAPRNVKFSLPAFVASATGARPKGCSQMIRPTGVTTVTSSTATRPSVFPNVQSHPFVPQTKTVPVVETLAPTVALIFWIRGFVVKIKNVAMDNNNNNVLHHNLRAATMTIASVLRLSEKV